MLACTNTYQTLALYCSLPENLNTTLFIKDTGAKTLPKQQVCVIEKTRKS
jgi:hypothetical protein